MTIKRLISGTTTQIASITVGGAAAKVNEGTSRLINAVGGWGPFRKITASGKDKVASAAGFLTEAKTLQAQGLTPEQVEEEIRRQSPQEPTDLDKLETDLTTQALLDGEITAAQLKSSLETGAQGDLISHKVKLVEKGVDEVIFDVMPEVVENRTVEYEAIAPPQHPTAFQKYKGTSSTQWTVQATLTCRNTDEATENLRIINVLRGWTMPFFGQKTASVYPDKLGAPPPVLEFSGWRDQMVGPVQVVITSLNWNFPQDVDYIPARGFKKRLGRTSTRSAGNRSDLEFSGELIPFPTVIKIAIQLVESFSTDQVNGFDLSAFRIGQFDLAFQSISTGAQELPNQRQGSTVGAPTTAGAPVAPVQQEAQQLVPTIETSRGQRSDRNPAQRVYAGLAPSVQGGRGSVIPPARVSRDVVTEELSVTPFVSGVGPEFGGNDNL